MKLDKPITSCLPVKLVEGTNGSAALAFRISDSASYIEIIGTNIGSTTIDHKDSIVILLADDRKVAFGAIGLQTFVPSLKGNTYQHRYYINEDGLKVLGGYEIRAIQKQVLNEYVQIDVNKRAAQDIQKQSLSILSELNRARRKNQLFQVGINEIADHIGDSVVFCGSVFITRVFESPKAQALILDFQTSLDGPGARAIIWKEDQKKFKLPTNSFFTNKDICIRGLVYSYDGVPYIQVSDQSQLMIKEVANSKNVSLPKANHLKAL